MDSIFAKLVQSSVMASWLILEVIALRFLLKKVPKRIICLLWAVVALRLIFPFSIESPASLIPETSAAIQEVIDTTLIHPEESPLPVAGQDGEEKSNTANRVTAASVSPASLIWSVGTSLMLGYLLFGYLNMRRRVQEAVRETDNIWICDNVNTPFIMGIVHPKIYLPSGLSEQNRGYVIAHEKSHLRCKDHWWKPVAFLLLSVFWFNPLLWLAYFLFCRDIEYACDERVIQDYSLFDKKAYSSALLECSGGRKLVLSCPIAFGETAVIQRIRNVLNYRKPRLWIVLIALVAVAVTAVGFLTVPKKDVSRLQTMPEEVNLSIIEPEKSNALEGEKDISSNVNPKKSGALEGEWDISSDGVQIKSIEGDHFTGLVMAVSDPNRVYLATSSESFSKDIPGKRIDEVVEREQAVAAVNAGPFFDDGSASKEVGSVPYGLVLSDGETMWDAFNDNLGDYGFVGFNQENILIVSSSMTQAEAERLEIRDGCTSGPILMINGRRNEVAYEDNSGYLPRTAIGQRTDGTIIFVCIEGRRPDSLGASYADLIDILTEYDVVNACNLQHGSATSLCYRDTAGSGEIQILNRFGVGQESPRRLPTFWMVKSGE